MAQFGVDPLCRLKLFLNAEPILTEPVTAGGAREPQAGREGGWQFVHGHRVDCRGGALEEHGGQLVDQANVN